jgi:tRNA(Ile)-lysidine synthase
VPPEGAQTRFINDVKVWTGNRIDCRFGLCVSGGPDSIALLLLAQGAGLICEAATVNHGLRDTAGDEADQVALLCRTLGVRHAILTLDTPVNGNESAWARRERYAALAAWAEDRDLEFLLTAHHADDQLETMIMRLNRGSGVAGLAGVRGQNDGLARPLLQWRKAELVELVVAAGVTPVDDPSNHNDRYDRARLRKALAGADWLDPIAASRSAAALAEADFALNWAAEAYTARRVAVQNGVLSFDPRGLPRELLRRIVLRCLKMVEPEAPIPRGESLDRLLVALGEDRIGTLGGVKCTGGVFWLFTKAPPRREN